MSKKEFSLQLETEAMKNIALELEQLPQESQQRIVQWLTSIVSPSSQTPSTSNYPHQNISELNVVEPTYPKGEHIKEFFHAKKPKNNYQKLAVLGYYLEFMKGKDEFNTQDLKIAWRQTREALPSRMVFSNSVNNTLNTYNYLVSSTKKGLYRIGIRGQNLVEGLPNQSKALAGPVKRKRKKKSSRKSIK
ncbi:MAG: hypothetical protein ACYSWZ_10455 [Planctomycetota bacterium]|jgi:hypothetical protein